MIIKRREGRKKIVIIYLSILCLSLLLFISITMINHKKKSKVKTAISKIHIINTLQETDSDFLDTLNVLITKLPTFNPEYPLLISSKCNSTIIDLNYHQEKYSLNFNNQETPLPNIFGNYSQNIRDYMRSIRYCLTNGIDRIFLSKENVFETFVNIINQILSKETLGNFLKNISYLQKLAENSIKEDNSYPGEFITEYSEELNTFNHITKQLLKKFKETTEKILVIYGNLKNGNYNENKEESTVSLSSLLVQFKTSIIALPAFLILNVTFALYDIEVNEEDYYNFDCIPKDKFKDLNVYVKMKENIDFFTLNVHKILRLQSRIQYLNGKTLIINKYFEDLEMHWVLNELNFVVKEMFNKLIYSFKDWE